MEDFDRPIDILDFYERVVESNILFCSICLRTAHETKIINSPNYGNLLQITSGPRSVKPGLVCYICEARVCRALKLIQAVQLAEKMARLFQLLKTVHKPGKDYHIPPEKLQKTLEIDSSHFAKMRKSSVLAITDTLMVSTRMTDCKRVSSKNSIESHKVKRSDSKAGRLRHTSSRSKLEALLTDNQDSTSKENILVEDKEDYVVIIENGISSEDKLFSEYSTTSSNEVILPDMDTVIIDDDSNDSNSKESGATNKVVPPKLVPIEKLKAPNPQATNNPQKTNIISPTVTQQLMPMPNSGFVAMQRDDNSQLFILHPIVCGPDNLLYAPTLSSRLVDNQLEYVSPETLPKTLLNSQPIITNKKPEGVVNNVLMSNVNNLQMVLPKDQIAQVKDKLTPGNVRTEQNDLCIESAAREEDTALLVSSPKDLKTYKKSINLNKESCSEKLKRVDKIMEDTLKRMSVQNLPKIDLDTKKDTKKGNHVNCGNSQPLLKDGNIDWEDKIPMDVITYMDEQPSQKRKLNEVRNDSFGFISEVYSEGSNTKKRQT